MEKEISKSYPIKALRSRISSPPVLKKIGSGVLIAVAAILLYRLAAPPPPAMTNRDIVKVLEKYLKERKPEPTAATRAFASVQRSVVLIQAFMPGAKKAAPASLGTGIIVDDTGSILTNLHVVAGGEKLRVTYFDGFETDAALVSAMPDNDLAVIKAAVIPDDITPAVLAGSGHLQIGDEVVAVGNPFGIAWSVSAGVVSGLGRGFESPKTGQKISNMIQFDAAVNPGNSGGPLLDRNGEVVGIVTALFNPTDQEVFIGIGFAVTIESAGGALGIPPW
jgi:S1-C subfamily serine protease